MGLRRTSSVQLLLCASASATTTTCATTTTTTKKSIKLAGQENKHQQRRASRRISLPLKTAEAVAAAADLALAKKVDKGHNDDSTTTTSPSSNISRRRSSGAAANEKGRSVGRVSSNRCPTMAPALTEPTTQVVPTAQNESSSPQPEIFYPSSVGENSSDLHNADSGGGDGERGIVEGVETEGGGKDLIDKTEVESTQSQVGKGKPKNGKTKTGTTTNSTVTRELRSGGIKTRRSQSNVLFQHKEEAEANPVVLGLRSRNSPRLSKTNGLNSGNPMEPSQKQAKNCKKESEKEPEKTDEKEVEPLTSPTETTPPTIEIKEPLKCDENKKSEEEKETLNNNYLDEKQNPIQEKPVDSSVVEDLESGTKIEYLELAARILSEQSDKLVQSVENEDGKETDLKTIASNSELLDEIVLTTPNTILKETLCAVLNQEQQAQQLLENQSQELLSDSGKPSSQQSSQIGLQKSDVDQMLGEFMSTSDIDLFQVLKDDGTSGGENNLLSLISNVGDDDEGIEMLVESTNQNVINTSRQQDRMLRKSLTDLHKSMDPEQEDQKEELDLLARKEMLNEMEKMLVQMQRRHDFLLRRLRKVQSHYMGRQVSEEVVGLFEMAHRIAKQQTSTAKPKYLKGEVEATLKSFPTTISSPSPNMVLRAESPPLPPIQFTPEATLASLVTPVSPAVLKAYVKRIASDGQQPSNVNNSGSNSNSKYSELSPKLLGNFPVNNSSVNSGSAVNNRISKEVKLDPEIRTSVDKTAGMLKTELRLVEKALDSDATASSSGGESADEMINYANHSQEPLSIAKRAAWRWARDRAGVATRWNWLMAQISDLEYRIRQHSELHSQIRRTKGSVHVSSNRKRGLSNSELSPGGSGGSSSQTLLSPNNVNGYRGQLPGNLKDDGLDGFAADVEDDGQTCRSRPFQRTSYKKRRLFQTMNLHTISKKMAKPSTLKCGCQWPMHPCALCMGRHDPTTPRGLPDTMSPAERVALLDPGFHPILSFPHDVSQNVHCEAVMGVPEWQTKIVRNGKNFLKNNLMGTTPLTGNGGVIMKGHKLASKKALEDGKKVAKKYTQGIFNKIKKSKTKSRNLYGKYGRLMKQKSKKSALKSMFSMNSQSGTHSFADGYGQEYESIPRSKNSSPTMGYNKHDRLDRRSRNSYDIDNIVIPYSVAASTRVEILPYKEIPTPKWKIIDDTDLDEEIQIETSQHQQHLQSAASSDSNCSTITALEIDSEETLEEYINEKHNRSLLEERRKFSTFLKFPYSTRSRANRRIDSRAESTSGANTPDPTSPAPNTPLVQHGDQESIPSPSCPSTPAPEQDGLGQIQPPLSIPMSRSERRRTTSLKMLGHQMSNASSVDMSRRSHTPEPQEPQFDALSFPLTDDAYDKMLKQMPEDHQHIENYIAHVNLMSNRRAVAADPMKSVLNDNESSVLLENMLEPDTETDSLGSGIIEEDPNDPEWCADEDPDSK